MLDHPSFAEGEIVGGGDIRSVVYGSDRGMYVEFRMEDVHQTFLSEQQGKPVYRQIPYIKIYTPGDKTKVVDREVRTTQFGDTPPDTVRFPAQWAAFKAGAAQVQDGMPLKQWPQMTTSQVRMLESVNIFTVEALAEVNDGALEGLGHGGRALRDQAILYLAAQKDDTVLMKLAAELAALKEKVAENEAANEAKRGPGRPRKEETDD